MFYDSLFSGLLLVARVTLLYEVSPQIKAALVIIFSFSLLGFHPFIGPLSSKLMLPFNKRPRAISHLAGKTNESGHM